jgi:hypothetical protein
MALILEVWINGERHAVAGHEALSVLSTVITASGRLGSDSEGTVGQQGAQEVHLHVGGLTSRGAGRPDHHLRWGGHRELLPGDEVRVVVREGDDYEPAPESHPADRYPSLAANSPRASFLRARATYFRLRGKYGLAADKRDERQNRRYARFLRG